MTETPPPAPPAQDFFRYDLLTQSALRGVVRDVLMRVSREGVPGDHHFYISFRTTDPGVRLSQRLKERYPAEMTIVLQHQFWDLDVDDDGFEVGLSFGNVPEKLAAPFRAVTGFFDPSVQFGLKFDHPDAEDDAEVEDAPPESIAPASNAPSPTEPLGEEAPGGGAQVVSLDKFRKK
ncbi:ClpXP protease specificity-enhancing factor SspB [Methylopila sp. M107]|uniref:SspB family protein n=1 Tax=Methylopila sp. M107 TaxID=1101190 RepID=UPI0003729C81|nr:ClpXP protease specificity-enhancing factor SspB [Methylopila sp. M107]